MVIQDLSSEIVFLDSAPLIYFIEGHSLFNQKLAELFKANDNGEFYFISSVITLLEVLVQPLKENRDDLVDQYCRILLSSQNLRLKSVDSSIAIEAARLRVKYNIKTPDSIQLAIAIQFGAKFFLTNDMRLQTITEISIILLKDLTD